MSDVRLTYAGNMYWDRTLALIDGTVRPAGIDFHYEVLPIRGLFHRLIHTDDFDAAEMSLGTTIALLARGDRRFVSLPVFPSRNFRHGYIFVNSQSGIEAPSDLRGRKVGVPEYQMTAATWIRDFLARDHGVMPNQLRWLTGGLEVPGYDARYSITLPSGVDLQIIPEDRTLEGMLESGELDVLVTANRPKSFMKPGSTVRRLFPDYQALERSYFRRTGIFPIMHTVVIRRAVYEANPWIAGSLFAAFEQARNIGWVRIAQTGQLAIGLPWLMDELEEIDGLFAGRDPWAYGIEPNRATLEALLAASFEQGLTPRRVTISELFAETSG